MVVVTPKNLGLNAGITRIFLDIPELKLGTVFGQSTTGCGDCLWTVQGWLFGDCFG